MLAQSATAALYLQTRARREQRLAPHNNNNTHNAKNRNVKNIDVLPCYSPQTHHTPHNIATYGNIKETVARWHQYISSPSAQPPSGSCECHDPTNSQLLPQPSHLQHQSVLQQLLARQPWGLSRCQQPGSLQRSQQFSSNLQESRQLGRQHVFQPSCLLVSHKPCSIHAPQPPSIPHVSQQPSVSRVSQESSVPYASQHPRDLFLTDQSSGSQLSQLVSKFTAWSEQHLKGESWKINNWKYPEWTKSGNWTPEWLRNNEIGKFLTKSKDWGSEWLTGEREHSQPSDMPLVPIGDWLGLREDVQEGIEMIVASYAQVLRWCLPAVLVYDSGVCTREEDDPAHAVLYFRPRHTPTTARTALAGQLAGVVHFCRHAFATPTIVRTRHAHIALKDYGRFVVMVCGRGGEWARARLTEVTRLLDASTGGLPHLWLTCGYNQHVFTDRLTEVLDALLPQALPDADFGEDEPLESPYSTSSSTPSPATEASESSGVAGNGGGTSRKEEREEEEEEEALKLLHRIFNAVPSVQLPKSGGGVFLRAQQLVEICQQQPGVLAGATMHKDRVLNSQMNSDLAHVLASIPVHNQKKEVLEDRRVEYQLPGGVQLLRLHVPKETHAMLRAHLPKSMPRRGERGLHSEAASMDLASLRSVLLSRQSLHSYPSTLPTATETSLERCSSPQESQKLRPHPPRGPSLMARISGCSDLESRPSQSLPGSPRKIRVAATLPDVGGNSPDLRYKVLVGRKARPPASSHSTPRRMPGGRNGLSRNHDTANNGINLTSKRGFGVGITGLPRYNVDKRNTPNNKLLNNTSDLPKPILKNGTVTLYDSEKSESGFEDGIQSDSELNIKNTKNKLNLQFAPDKINRPSHEIELDGLSNDEPKITREINGNLSKDYDSNGKDSPNGNLVNLRSQMMDFKDESDTSRSEESEISVLDLSSFIETKENGDRQLAEAVRGLMELTTRDADQDASVPGGQSIENQLMESGEHDVNGSAEGWEVLTLYTQKHSDTVLHLLLSSAAPANPQLIYSLWRLGLSGLEDVQAAVERAIEVSEGGDGGDAFLQWSYSVLSAVTPAALDMALISTAHQDFKHNRELMEVTLRSREAVLWGHRHSNTQTFYQVNAAPRPGLPIPSDIMAKVPHRARRRLDRDHNITLL
ncbi:uncharacterized protein HPS4 isoform X1 [Procambarus clarkii]|uniref:uncharacterized protein HPS4 isoform X1 n=1 Tax=Procambarus clarkii TaxID=6728 RepID=UPI00374315B9